MVGGSDISMLTDRALSGAFLNEAADIACSLGEKFKYWGSVKYKISGAPKLVEGGVVAVRLALEASYSLENPEDDVDSRTAVELYWQRFWLDLKPQVSLGSLQASYWGSADDFRLPETAGHRPLYLSHDDVVRTLAGVLDLGKELNSVPNLESRRLFPSIQSVPFPDRKDTYNLSYSISTGIFSQLKGPFEIPGILHRLPDGANQEECPTLVLEHAVQEACKGRNICADRSLSLIVYSSERL